MASCGVLRWATNTAQLQGTITCASGTPGIRPLRQRLSGDSVVINGNQVTFDAVTNAATAAVPGLSFPDQPIVYPI